MRKPDPKTELIRAECAAWVHLPTKTLARKLYAARTELWPNLEACYQAVRYARGAIGGVHRTRPGVTALRAAQPAGFTWRIPKSIAEPWMPFALDAERTLVLSDIHVPFHDTPALQAVVKSALRWNPDCILLNGDVCDFFTISRFDKNPSVTRLRDELNATRQFLHWLRQKFPRARMVYKFGNHDERFSHYLWRKAPELFELEQLWLENLLQLADKKAGTPGVEGVEFLTNQERITLGHLDVLHGHELGKSSIAPPVNPARGTFLKTMECTLSAHLHRSSQHRERSSRGKQIACWSQACLCGLWPDYAKVNKWNHGAARVDLHGLDFNVALIDVIEGKVV